MARKTISIAELKQLANEEGIPLISQEELLRFWAIVLWSKTSEEKIEEYLCLLMDRIDMDVGLKVCRIIAAYLD